MTIRVEIGMMSAAMRERNSAPAGTAGRRVRSRIGARFVTENNNNRNNKIGNLNGVRLEWMAETDATLND